jgi:hypothetical protein
MCVWVRVCRWGGGCQRPHMRMCLEHCTKPILVCVCVRGEVDEEVVVCAHTCVCALLTMYMYCLPYLSAASAGFQWAPVPKDGDVIQAFKGDTIVFPFEYTLSAREQITSIEWMLAGFSQTMVAFQSEGYFLAGPEFRGRVQQTANGGLILSHVTDGDAGNYSTRVNLRRSDSYTCTIVLQVTSELCVCVYVCVCVCVCACTWVGVRVYVMMKT